jgi:AbiU2
MGRPWEDNLPQPENADGGAEQTIVYEISDVGFTDGIEIKQLIQLLEIQNNEGVNEALNLNEAGSAGLILRNALISRLVLLVSRVHAPSREHDMHVGRAFDLLKDGAIGAEIETRGPLGSLRDAIETWQKLKGDHRLPKIKQFRDKYTAHLGKPKPEIPLPEFSELFSFARDTTKLLDQLARATGSRCEGLDTWDDQLRESAKTFWKPWMAAGG